MLFSRAEEQIELALYAGRHEMPVNQAIFKNTLNPMDFKRMEEESERNGKK